MCFAVSLLTTVMIALVAFSFFFRCDAKWTAAVAFLSYGQLALLFTSGGFYQIPVVFVCLRVYSVNVELNVLYKC